ncbi:MAG TPA: hypothetical protein VHD35_16455 [Chitinophagaceae bacterium]|jgi:hypothetical protein|nr:hypothetical protein [Chitinophagaceae bacterium]
MTDQEQQQQLDLQKKAMKQWLLIGLAAGAMAALAICLVWMGKREAKLNDKIMKLEGWQ